VQTITRNLAWDAEPYNGALPPPLCFTVPAGNLTMTSKTLVAGATPAGYFGPGERTQKLMMDPSDPATWQRTYRFT
jgi:hypothetical protein